MELRSLAFSVEPSSTIHNVIERMCTLDGTEKGFELYLIGNTYFSKTKEKRDVCRNGKTIFTTSISSRGGKIVRRALLWHLGCFMFYPMNNVLWKRDV